MVWWYCRATEWEVMEIRWNSEVPPSLLYIKTSLRHFHRLYSELWLSLPWNFLITIEKPSRKAPDVGMAQPPILTVHPHQCPGFSELAEQFICWPSLYIHIWVCTHIYIELLGHWNFPSTSQEWDQENRHDSPRVTQRTGSRGKSQLCVCSPSPRCLSARRKTRAWHVLHAPRLIVKGKIKHLQCPEWGWVLSSFRHWSVLI